MDRRTTGAKGEEAAARYLEDRGHTVLTRNWRGGRVELDIVTRSLDGLHFVEVKSRTAPVMADPSVNVNYMKQKHLHAAAGRWLAKHPEFRDLEVFFDIVTVVFDGPDVDINFYPQAFIPIYA